MTPMKFFNDGQIREFQQASCQCHAFAPYVVEQRNRRGITDCWSKSILIRQPAAIGRTSIVYPLEQVAISHARSGGEDGKPTGRPHLTGVRDHQAVDLLRSKYLPKIGSTD